MSDNLVKLLTQRFDIERRIHQLKNSNLTESQSAGADAMLAKLEAALAKVNEEYAIQQNMPMAEKENHPAPTDQPDHEVNMARSDLYRAGKSAMALEKMLQQVSEQQGIEGWVQAKITKAADYLESVYHYFDYEMNGNGEVDEAAAYGPGQSSTNPEAEENAMNQKPMALGGQQQQPQAPGAPQQSQQLKPGQASATPPVGGAGPMSTSDGMVKMAKLGPDKKPLGIPVMVKPMEIMAKQKQGFFVIGESASAGASSAGGMGASPTGFASGGIGMQSRKKMGEGFFGIDDSVKGKIQNIVSKLSDEPGNWDFRRQEFTDAGMKALNIALKNNPKFIKYALGLTSKDYEESVEEGNSDAGYGPKDRGVADGYYGRPANPHKVVTDETGKRMRVKLTDPAEIAEYMAGYKDDSFGSKNYGESADKKVYKEKPVDTKKAAKIKAYRADRDKNMEEETGPKFTGYYKGTDKGKPGKKMVGGM